MTTPWVSGKGGPGRLRRAGRRERAYPLIARAPGAGTDPALSLAHTPGGRRKVGSYAAPAPSGGQDATSGATATSRKRLHSKEVGPLNPLSGVTGRLA